MASYFFPVYWDALVQFCSFHRSSVNRMSNCSTKVANITETTSLCHKVKDESENFTWDFRDYFINVTNEKPWRVYHNPTILAKSPSDTWQNDNWWRFIWSGKSLFNLPSPASPRNNVGIVGLLWMNQHQHCVVLGMHRKTITRLHHWRRDYLFTIYECLNFMKDSTQWVSNNVIA